MADNRAVAYMGTGRGVPNQGQPGAVSTSRKQSAT
jgi:hypothetical protein